MSKTIVFTVTNDLTYDQRMIRICTSLAQNGYDVTLVGRMKNISKSIDNQPFTQHRFHCFFQKGKFFYLEYNLRLFFFLAVKKYDAVCAIDLDTILPAFWISHWRKKTMIYDAHEYFTEVPEVVHRPFTKKIWEAIAAYHIPRIQHCYTVGEGLAAVFSKRYKVDFQVIRNISIAKKKIENNAKPKEKIILYQGMLNLGRGLEAAIEAMQSVENATLWLAGEGDLSMQLRQLVKDKSLENKVIFHGLLKPNDLANLTQKAYIGLNLLENQGLSYYYSLANKTFDYLHASVPALHPDFPEYQAIMQQNEVGILVKNLSPSLIATQLNRLLNDDAYYEFLQKNCIAAAQTYNWQKEEKHLLQLYKGFFSAER